MTTRHLFLVLVSVLARPASSGELLLFANPSIRSIDWKTPGSALRSSGWSQIHNLISHENPATVTAAVGHVVVRFDCVDTLGRRHDVWTGMTGQNDFAETKKDLVDDAIGIGVLFKPYLDGSVDPSEKSRNQVANYYGRLSSDSGLLRRERLEPRFLRVSLDGAACDRLADFYATFRELSWDKKKVPLALQRQRPLDQILSFGFTIDPYEAYLKRAAGDPSVALGGGCSSFALAFLKLAGGFEPFFEKKFVREILVSEKLIGGKWGRIKDNRVPPLEIAYGSKGRSWTDDAYPHRRLRFYDVEKIWNFLGQARACAQDLDSKDCPSDVARWTRERGVDASSYAFDAVRTEIHRTPRPSHKSGAPLAFDEKRVVKNVRVEREGIRLAD
jgi:hypothetical protein